MCNMEEKTEPVRVLKYNSTRCEPFVGINKPFPSKSQLVNKGLENLLDELEAKEAKN